MVEAKVRGGVREAVAVIGANYGDEGKGAAVDRLVRDDAAMVVRANGGAQAGHTVVTPDGRRHVFHHVGSGAFRGASTYESRLAVASPMHLVPELDALAGLGVVPTILLDRDAPLTTPFDMVLNQVVETARGGSRHGSTGYGFGETIERGERGWGTRAGDLADLPLLRDKLVAIRDRWVPQRLAALGVAVVPEAYEDALRGDAVVDAFLAVARGTLERASLVDVSVLARARHVVFEGAQGLGLDQQRGAFPYVTRSFTGLRNVLAIARDAGIERIEAVYATRCTLTRHGAGPLEGELANAPVPGFRDDTNVPNPWQGRLRFAHLDVAAMGARIRADLGDAEGSGIMVDPSITVSCLDQAGPELTLVGVDDAGTGAKETATADAAEVIAQAIGLALASQTWGPSRRDAIKGRWHGGNRHQPSNTRQLASCLVPAFGGAHRE